MNEQNNPVVGNVTNPMPQPITPSPEVTPVAPVETPVAPVPAPPVVEPTPVVAPMPEVSPTPVVAPTPVAEPSPVVAPIPEVTPIELAPAPVVEPAPAPVVEPAPVAPVAPVAPTEPQVIPGTPTEPVTPDALNTSVETDLSAPVDNTVAPVVMAATNETQTPPQTMSVSDLMAPPPGAPNPAPVQTMTQNDNSTDGVSPEDDTYVRAFVGEKYDSFKNSKFNVGAFFFPVPYFFYRKMFLYGLLLMVISSIILFVFSSANTFGMFIIWIGSGLLANPLYLGFANNKVAEIKARNAAIKATMSSEKYKAMTRERIANWKERDPERYPGPRHDRRPGDGDRRRQL